MKKPNLFKHILSFFLEVPVADFSSEYNSRLDVVYHRGRYKLITHGAIYSFGDLYSNYRKSFEALNWDKYKPSSCLILGLGLGSIPEMLVSRFNKKINFTAVEIDEVIIRLAMEYVLRPKGIKVQIFTADAASFLEWHHGKYDLICSDVFIGDRIPEALQSESALLSMKGFLKPNGLLLYNRLSRFEPDIAENLKFSEEIFLKVFPAGGYLDVDGNWMFVNDLKAFEK